MLMYTLILSLASCGATPAVSSEDSLRVMAWNVLHGSNDVDRGPEKTLAVIREAAPDVILMQESYDIDGDRPKLGKWLSEQLDWNYYQAESPHLCVLTPLELEAEFFHHQWHGLGALLTDEQGRSCLAWSIWLDYRSFITYELRDNPDMSDEELLAAEHVRSARLPQATALIEHLKGKGHLSADIPVIVGGDWNTPSHLDWTTDTARVFKRRRALPLPVSIAMRDAGFADTFRAVHPDPVQQPGITWSPMFRMSGDTEQGFDRIDRIYLKNPAKPVGDWTLHPVAATVLPIPWEDDSIEILQRQFPSDHGAVVVDLEWRQIGITPVVAPPIVAKPIELRVLAFNILTGGNGSGPNGASPLAGKPRHAAIAAAIERVDPHVVLVQEEGGELRIIELLQANDPAWHRRGGGERGQAVYARYPIEGINQNTSRIMHPDGPFVVHNVHWPPYPYGPYEMRTKLLAGEPVDVQEILQMVDKGEVYADAYRSVQPSLAAGLPVIVGGDFNEPSHLDWTARYAQQGSERWVDNPTDTVMNHEIAWKGTSMLANPESYRDEFGLESDAPLPGMIDAFRAIRPNEVADLGITWTPRYAKGSPGRGNWGADGFDDALAAQPTTILDRIDMIHVSDNLTPRSVLVLGDAGDPNSDIEFADWPSDHRAVLATLWWTPGK